MSGTFNKNPAKGMRDFLPDEKAFREQVLAAIRKSYVSFGFSEIETPCVENIGNLLSKQGGENEKLIYKILKRGEKLDNANPEDLCDLGLRFDLTVPLARYYANNGGNLPSVFKTIQIGNVWRAENPQKGRYRQFVQCDIDIIGDATKQAEIELILATCAALQAVQLQRFSIVINDRRVLKGLAASAGIEENQYDSAFIALDKLDKIGRDKVVAELAGQGISETSAARFTDNAIEIAKSENGLQQAKQLLSEKTEASVFEDLDSIIGTVRQVGGYDIRFSCTLVRGMSYYTGPIFEVVSQDFGSSVGGGGRYDKMLGRFLGRDVPACGFSIGFERITSVLADAGVAFDTGQEKNVIFVEQNAGDSTFSGALKHAQELRAQGRICLVTRKNKNFGFQKTQLEKEGYSQFFKVNDDGVLTPM